MLQCEGRIGALPLLQYALHQLWPEHVAGRLAETRWSSRLIEDFEDLSRQEHEFIDASVRVWEAHDRWRRHVRTIGISAGVVFVVVVAIVPGQGRLGNKANVPLDAHGCPACPHPAIGLAIQGSPDVNVNRCPALRVDDLVEVALARACGGGAAGRRRARTSSSAPWPGRRRAAGLGSPASTGRALGDRRVRRPRHAVRPPPPHRSPPGRPPCRRQRRAGPVRASRRHPPLPRSFTPPHRATPRTPLLLSPSDQRPRMLSPTPARPLGAVSIPLPPPWPPPPGVPIVQLVAVVSGAVPI